LILDSQNIPTMARKRPAGTTNLGPTRMVSCEPMPAPRMMPTLNGRKAKPAWIGV